MNKAYYIYHTHNDVIPCASVLEYGPEIELGQDVHLSTFYCVTSSVMEYIYKVRVDYSNIAPGLSYCVTSSVMEYKVRVEYSS